jgi:tetratricopeptide (TPR) repeat protein
MRSACIVIWAISMLLFPRTAISSTIDVPSEYGFAVYLMHNSEYQRALEELDQLSQKDKSSAAKIYVPMLSGECLARIGNLSSAINAFSPILEEAAPPEIKAASVIRIAECYIARGENDSAREVLTNHRGDWSDSDLSDIGDLLIGVSYFRNEEFERRVNSSRSICQSLLRPAYPVCARNWRKLPAYALICQE